MQAGIQRFREKWEKRHPGLDTSSMDIVGPLKRANALLELALEPLFDGAPVTPSELDTMLKLRHVEQPMISRQLATTIGRSGAAVSKTLAKLERRGLIARTPNPADRRAAFVELTEDGIAVVDAMFPRQLGVEAKLVRVDAERRARIIDGLAALVETLEDVHRAAPTREALLATLLSEGEAERA